jgi:signal peptide peptidase SppA
MRYAHVLDFVQSQPWAILPEKLAIISFALAEHVARGGLSDAEIEARIEAAGGRRSAPRAQSGAIAVLPLFGTISHRAGMFSDSSGGTSTEAFTQAFRQVMADPSITSVVIDIDSPGGTVAGVDELAAEILAARGKKPIVAVANALAASAAYYIAASADEVVVTASGEVGSIGVFTAHQDLSRALEQTGVTTTLISAGKYKTEANPFQPLGEEARAAIQARADEYYAMFTRSVARGRGVSVDAVRTGFGEGRVVGARQALTLGMVDRIGTLDDTIARLASGTWTAPTSTRAETVGTLRIDEVGTPPVALENTTTSSAEARRRRLRIIGT